MKPDFFVKDPLYFVGKLDGQNNVFVYYDFIKSQMSFYSSKDVNKKSIKVTVADEKKAKSISVYLSMINICNFNCKDCATSIHTRKADLVVTNADDLIERVELISSELAKNGGTHLQLKYAGGEPLMPLVINKSIIPAQKRIKQIVKKYNLKLEQVILTNGYFLDASIEQLKKIDEVIVSVSLWGIGDKNDSLRGNTALKSYERIVRGLQKLDENKIKFSVHHVIGPDVENLKYFMEVMWNVDSPDFIGKKLSNKNEYWFKKSIPTSFNILRPQNYQQLKEMLDNNEYQRLADGINEALVYLQQLVKEGKTIPVMTTIDYLDFNQLKSFTCGSGHSYIAIEKGSEPQPCHQLLATAKSSEQLSKTILEDVSKLVERASAVKDVKPVELTEQEWQLLSLHAGGGCPLTRKLERENGLTNHTSILYSKILKNFLMFLALQLWQKHKQNS